MDPDYLDYLLRKIIRLARLVDPTGGVHLCRDYRWPDELAFEGASYSFTATHVELLTKAEQVVLRLDCHGNVQMVEGVNLKIVNVGIQ